MLGGGGREDGETVLSNKALIVALSHSRAPNTHAHTHIHTQGGKGGHSGREVSGRTD